MGEATNRPIAEAIKVNFFSSLRVKYIVSIGTFSSRNGSAPVKAVAAHCAVWAPFSMCESQDCQII